MNNETADAIVDDLIAKAVSHLEPVAVQLGDALGNLENRKVLGAIAALTGCEEAINRANLALVIARDYAEKLARARATVNTVGNDSESIGPSQLGTTQRTDVEAESDSAIEVLSSEAELNALEPIDIIASGYEFNCPECETYNTLISIPKYGNAIECHNCHVRFRISEATHAHD